jgi:hypothetical protein
MSGHDSGATPKTQAAPNPARHARKCCICIHPDRAGIEEDFLHWVSPEVIAREYNLYDRRAIYRHAHATGLSARRSRKLRFVLESFLEPADKVAGNAYRNVTASDIISAVKLYSHINDDGNLIRIPKTIHHRVYDVSALEKAPGADSPRSKETAYEMSAPGQPVNRHQTESHVSP